MFLSSVKEVHYFDRNYEKGLSWYRSFFPPKIRTNLAARRLSSRPAVGETTPNYLYHPHTPGRVARLLPDAKLVVLLRNPIERAFSGYWYRVAQKQEELPSFEEAVAAEPERLEGELEKMLEDPLYHSERRHLYGYLARGLYAEQLQRWLEHFPRQSFLIERSEDFFTDPAGTLVRVCGFLEVPEYSLVEYRRYNDYTRAAIEPGMRRRLQDYFRPHNERLYELIGRDLDWDA